MEEAYAGQAELRDQVEGNEYSQASDSQRSSDMGPCHVVIGSTRCRCSIRNLVTLWPLNAGGSGRVEWEGNGKLELRTSYRLAKSSSTKRQLTFQETINIHKLSDFPQSISR